MNLHQPTSALTECDREPIHQIGAVQAFGALIAVDAAGKLVQCSANLAEMLGLAALPAPGTPLAEVIAPGARAILEQAIASLSVPDAIERRFGLDLAGTGALFDGAVHASGALSVIEFEPHASTAFADHVSMIVPVIAQLEQARSLEVLCDTAARLVRQMTGYDRVMIYRFHPDESGEVIAEDRDEALEPFKGLRYPAADIPQQARALFRRNRFRTIADTRAPAVPIMPAQGPQGEPLDLSMSMLRSPAQVHLTYMQNMDVSASLAIAIVRDERLWGMIACHHRSPRLPPFSLRTVADLLSQTFSLMLDRILVAQAEALRERARQLNDRLLFQMAGGMTLTDSLPIIEELLRDTIAHDGLSLFVDGTYRALGAAPDAGEFSAIVPMLTNLLDGAPHASTRLADEIPAAAAFAARAAGALVLPLSRGTRDAVVLWRRPLDRMITWAGDPAKAAVKPGEWLEPRASFAAWNETVRGHSQDWSLQECEIAARLRRTLIEVVLRMSEDLTRERARAAQQQDLLIAELNHRVRNVLGLIRALVSQSQHEALTVPGFAAILGGRIAALASAHDNITAENWGPAPLARLLQAELAPYCGSSGERFRLSGEDVLITPEAYTILALVVHELATNSAKYGSLSSPAGTVEVRLTRTMPGDLAIAWREIGGPPVNAPTRHGFGSTIITRTIPHDLQGTAELRYRLTGVEADFVIPARYLAGEESAPVAAPTASPRSDQEAPPSLDRPGHVLVVEDSIIIALDTEEHLRRLGVGHVRLESNVTGALAAIAERRPDFAIIDFNLGGESSEPVAAALRAAGVRFVLATGYSEGASGFERMGADAVLRKPYGLADIEGLLRGS